MALSFVLVEVKTLYVNLNKTIQTFWYLTLPILAISVAWLIMDIILNHEQCVISILMYYNNR